MKTETFQTEQFSEVVEVTIKGNKHYFIEGYIATTEPDLQNEVITERALGEMLTQIKSQNITMDLEHAEWLDESGNVLMQPKHAKIPVAKIVDAEIRTKSNGAKGVYVRAELNSALKDFNTLWASIKGKFLHAFSVAFYPVAAVKKMVNNVALNLVDSVRLVNVTLTGSPVNPGATFEPVMKAVLKSMEADTMTEEQTQDPKPEDQKPEEPKQEPKQEPAKDESKQDFEKERQEFEEVKKKLEEEKKVLESKLKEVEQNATAKIEEAKKQVQQVVDGPLASIKALQKEIGDLRSKLEQPVMKAQLGQDLRVVELEKQAKVEEQNPLDMLQ